MTESYGKSREERTTQAILQVIYAMSTSIFSNDEGVDWVRNFILNFEPRETFSTMFRIPVCELNYVWHTVISKSLEEQREAVASNCNWLVDKLIEDTKGSQVAFRTN